MVTNTLRRDPFHAIADPHRRAILSLVAKERLTLNRVAEHFTISRPAISKHIKILSEAGLIRIDQRGRERYCEAKLDGLNEVTDWIEEYRKLWEARFDRLEQYLAELQAKEAKSPAPKNISPITPKKHGRRT